jgi:hypothetical protein
MTNRLHFSKNPKTKKFGGNTYEHIVWVSLKSVAEQYAEKMKAQGWLVRIVPETHEMSKQKGYAVWIRKGKFVRIY